MYILQVHLIIIAVNIVVVSFHPAFIIDMWDTVKIMRFRGFYDIKFEPLQQKLLKARDNPKILKEYSPLLYSEKTQHTWLPNAILNDVKYVI